jgi:cytochrome c-type biogenesis protein CcmH/NrfF
MTRRRLPDLVVRCLLAASVAVAAAAEAQEARVPAGDTADRPAAAAHDVTRATQLLGTVMSPFCPGLTLANCPSVYAETLRVSVRARLDAGEAPDSIVESLVAPFGEGIRGAPRARRPVTQAAEANALARMDSSSGTLGTRP